MPCDRRHGVDCCVRVVVTVVAGGGAAIVVVRSVVVVCVVGADPQAASNAVPLRSVAANASRMPDFVLVMICLLVQGKIGQYQARTRRTRPGQCATG